MAKFRPGRDHIGSSDKMIPGNKRLISKSLWGKSQKLSPQTICDNDKSLSGVLQLHET
jgi:hypothetical protein